MSLTPSPSSPPSYAGPAGELTAVLQALTLRPHPRPIRILNLSTATPDVALALMAEYPNLCVTSVHWSKHQVRELAHHAHHELVVCLAHDRVRDEDALSLSRFALDNLAIEGVFLAVRALSGGKSDEAAVPALLAQLPGGPRFPIEIRKDPSDSFLVAKVRRVA